MDTPPPSINHPFICDSTALVLFIFALVLFIFGKSWLILHSKMIFKSASNDYNFSGVLAV